MVPYLVPCSSCHVLQQPAPQQAPLPASNSSASLSSTGTSPAQASPAAAATPSPATNTSPQRLQRYNSRLCLPVVFTFARRDSAKAMVRRASNSAIGKVTEAASSLTSRLSSSKSAPKPAAPAGPVQGMCSVPCRSF